VSIIDQPSALSVTESASCSRLIGACVMHTKNERVELEMKIIKYRQLARAAVTDFETNQRINALISQLQQKLRAIDE
jgi:hypothetical protein